MKKITNDTDWKEKDSAPMPTKGRKGADFINQTTTATGNRFPWTTVVIVILLLSVVGFVLFFVDGMG